MALVVEATLVGLRILIIICTFKVKNELVFNHFVDRDGHSLLLHEKQSSHSLCFTILGIGLILCSFVRHFMFRTQPVKVKIAFHLVETVVAMVDLTMSFKNLTV